MDNTLKIELTDDGGRWLMNYEGDRYGNVIDASGVEVDERLLFMMLVENFVDSYRLISKQSLSNPEDIKQTQKLAELL